MLGFLKSRSMNGAISKTRLLFKLLLLLRVPLYAILFPIFLCAWGCYTFLCMFIGYLRKHTYLSTPFNELITTSVGLGLNLWLLIELIWSQIHSIPLNVYCGVAKANLERAAAWGPGLGWTILLLCLILLVGSCVILDLIWLLFVVAIVSQQQESRKALISDMTVYDWRERLRLQQDVVVWCPPRQGQQFKDTKIDFDEILLLYLILLVGSCVILDLIWLLFVVAIVSQQQESRKALISDMTVYDWYGGDVNGSVSSKMSLFGVRRDRANSLRTLRSILTRHTVFRRFTPDEPIRLLVARGLIASLSLVILSGVLVTLAFVLPFTQFAKCLPQRPTFMHMSAWNDTVFPVSGALIISCRNDTDGTALLNHQINSDLKSNPAPFSAIYNDVACKSEIRPVYREWPEVNVVQGYRLLWGCGNIWDVNAISRGYYRHDDIRPISIRVNLSTFCVSPSALAGVHGTFQWEDRYYYPLEDLPQDDRFSQYTPWWVSPSSAGAQIYLRLTTLYWRPGSLWEIVGGEPKAPRVFSLPIVSFYSLPATSVNSSIQKIELFPAFGDSSNRVFREEYLSHTVFLGFAQTGGLYTVLDLLFRVLFGTTLLNIVMGRKLISPFGAISSRFESYMEDMATRRYVGIQDPNDPNRALATSDFLRDYVLDLDFPDPIKCNNTGDNQREGQQASPTGQQLELEDLSPESRKEIRAEQRDEKLPEGQAPRGTSIMNRWLSRGGRGSGRRGSTGETAERGESRLSRIFERSDAVREARQTSSETTSHAEPENQVMLHPEGRSNSIDTEPEETAEMSARPRGAQQ